MYVCLESVYSNVGLLVPRVGLQVDAYRLNDFGGSGHVANNTSTPHKFSLQPDTIKAHCAQHYKLLLGSAWFSHLLTNDAIDNETHL